MNQLLIPGTASITSAELAARKAALPLKPKAEQKPLDFGLFGDDAAQTDLVDMARAAAAPAPKPKKSRTVYCLKDNCGRSWPMDPALEVACPSCMAPIGGVCKRPSGHRKWGGQPCPDRDRLADRLGKYGVCPSGRCGCRSKQKSPL